MKSVDNLRQTLRTDDEEAFMDAVRNFLQTVNYDAWA